MTHGGNMTNQLPSETVIVEAPMSFTGSAKRIWRGAGHLTSSVGHATTERANAGGTAGTAWAVLAFLAVAVTWLTAVQIIAFAWMVILGWYVVFGVFLIPYRLIRRSQRKGQRDDLRHREMLAAVAQAQRQEPQERQSPATPKKG